MIKGEKHKFLINIKKEFPLSYHEKISYYKEKLMNLKHLKEKDIYDQIMYCDFNDEDELLIATYSLFNLFFCGSIQPTFNLYKSKLNYIGYDIEDFYNKENVYSIDELNRIKRKNSSKEILNYLIGLVTYINFFSISRKVNDSYKDVVDNICLKYFTLKLKS